LALVASQSPLSVGFVVVALFLAHSSVRVSVCVAVCVGNFTCACRAHFAAFLTADVDCAALITHSHTDTKRHTNPHTQAHLFASPICCSYIIHTCAKHVYVCVCANLIVAFFL